MNNIQSFKKRLCEGQDVQESIETLPVEPFLNVKDCPFHTWLVRLVLDRNLIKL
jgi:hypothetical protein